MLVVVCAYFNPFGSALRERAFLNFREDLALKNVPLICVEQFHEGVPVVGRSIDISVVGGDLIWQKECLLQIGIDAALKRGATKIIISDADILFKSEGALDSISNALEQFDFIQAFESISLSYGDKSIVRPSVLSQPPPRPFGCGHPGSCWAGTAEFFRSVSLYKYALLGGGDVVLTHLLDAAVRHHKNRQRFFDLCHYYCDNVLMHSLLHSIQEWGGNMLQSQYFKIGYASNVNVVSIDHGSLQKRRYEDRYSIWQESSSNSISPIPGVHFHLADSGLLEWCADIPKSFISYAKNYLRDRSD